MGRAKLKMELITKEKTRTTTYHKRKQGIIKKASELSILCDVNTAIIIFPPNSNNPEIWPENPDQITKAIDSYKAKKSDNGKRTYDLNDFFQDRKKKIEDELLKTRKRNMEAKYATWFDELDGLSEGQLRQFALELENKGNLVRHVEFQKRNMQMTLPLVDHHHVQMMSHQLVGHTHQRDHIGWLNDTASSSFVPVKREVSGGYGYGHGHGHGHGYGYGYPVFEGSVVYDNLNPYMINQWQQFQHAPEFATQEVVSQVNNGEDGGVGDFVMVDHQRFLGL